MMKKLITKILGATAAGAAIVGVIYYFTSKRDKDDDFGDDSFTDDDFDLDEDLKPASNREYVSLSHVKQQAGEKVGEAVEKVEEIASDIAGKAKGAAKKVKKTAKSAKEDVGDPAKETAEDPAKETADTAESSAEEADK